MKSFFSRVGKVKDKFPTAFGIVIFLICMTCEFAFDPTMVNTSFPPLAATIVIPLVLVAALFPFRFRALYSMAMAAFLAVVVWGSIVFYTQDRRRTAEDAKNATVAASLGTASLETAPAHSPLYLILTTGDIIKLSQAHVSDDVIIAAIQSHPGGLNLSSDDLIALKNAGVSDNVLKVVVTKE